MDWSEGEEEEEEEGRGRRGGEREHHLPSECSQ